MNKKLIALVFSVTLISVSNSLSYSKSISLNNQNLYSPEKLESEANQATNQGNYSRAALLFEKLIYQKPANDEYRLKYAYTLFLAKDYEKASSEFSKIVSTSKNSEYVKFAKTKLKEINANTKLASNKPKIKITSSNKIDKVNFIDLEDDDKDNYLCNERDPSIYPDKSGSYFRRWEKEDMPIKVYIPAVPKFLNAPDSNKYATLIKKAMTRWSAKVPQIIQYSFVDNEKSANIVVVWHDYFKDETWGNAYFPVYSTSLKRRVSLINMAVRAQLSNDNVFFSDEEFTQIATHEVGHTLGLGHSYASGGNDDLMRPVYRSTIPDNEVQISDRDIRSLIKLYSFPKSAAIRCKE